ncbi:hypothetical protein KEF29_10285 [Streptomyces tuirus]|uniref:Tetratricopeptide repeat protein n=1 Tax=Streptomyces tuirus TaxID=68278 RepID=A0A941J247_9ACTN|nr:hypothetical protein [Streptomyces tuirus]
MLRLRCLRGSPSTPPPTPTANVLSGVGRWEEALTITEEAVGLYRRLAAGNPAAHEPNLAIALTVWASAAGPARGGADDDGGGGDLPPARLPPRGDGLDHAVQAVATLHDLAAAG